MGEAVSVRPPSSTETLVAEQATAAPLDAAERGQLGRLRRWGTVGALLLMLGSGSSYGAATPIPNPVDGLRVIGLLSRIGPAALACSYAGIGLIVLCWVLIGRLAAPGRVRRLSRSQLSHTLAMWAVPLLVTPAAVLPRRVLLPGHRIDDEGGLQPVRFRARTTPSATRTRTPTRSMCAGSTPPVPYGPVYLLIAKGIVTVAGHNVIVGTLLQRLVELVGVAMIVWALPRLARICGFDPVAALWLGALNPLVLFHLIGGGHNEALMLGAMLAGMVIAWEWSLVVGVVVITLGVGIKATAGMALAFLVIMLALRAGGRWRDLLRCGVQVGLVAGVTFAAFTWVSGVGFGWLAALGAPGTVRSFLSLSTTLGVGAGQAGLLLGLGDHTQAALDVMQPVGTLIGATVALAIMWQCWQRRINPVLGLGVAMMAFVLLAPVIQPWYLLWAALPLAASTADPRYRKATVWLTVLFSVTIMPNGATIPVYVIVQAVIVASIVVGGAFYFLRRVGLPVTQPQDTSIAPDGVQPAGADSNDTVDDAGAGDAAAYPRSL